MGRQGSGRRDSGRRGRGRAARRVAMVLVAAQAIAGVTVTVAAPRVEAAQAWEPPTPDDVTHVAGVQDATWARQPTWSAAGHEVRGDSRVTWPAARTTTVELTGDLVSAAAALARDPGATGTKAGDLPVWLAPVAEAVGNSVKQVAVEVHERATATQLGVQGVLLDVGRADAGTGLATTALTVDYRDFAAASGGDWATRLRFVQLPACALTTPERAGCATATPLRSRNDPESGTVTGLVPLSTVGIDGAPATAGNAGTASATGTVVALAAGPKGDNGDYSATSLTPASTWDVSTQTGAFSWRLPLRVVPGVGGPTPDLAFSYSSQTMDGRTGGFNTQGSWAGDGFDLWPGFIERSYRSCAEDTGAQNNQDPNNKNRKTGDQCWWRANATLSLNGRATELVDAGNGRWKGRADDGSVIEQLTGAANGDDDGEHWKVTTVDGTQWFFGRQTGPGGASGATATQSTWVAEVYGNHPGDPGYTAGNFAGSRRTQAWRWNLDHVIDPHGNTMTLFYGKEPGAYGREQDPNKRTTYDRGGYLTRIEYGNRSDAPASTHAAARVELEVADRCKAGATCFDGNGRPIESAFPDTPVDQFCHAAPCTEELAPTFWTQKRLAEVRAQVHAGGGSYDDVESWTLRHEYLDAGAAVGEGVPMFLRGITHTGHGEDGDGDDVTDPEIVFDPGAEALPNRVDSPDDNRTALNRWRIKRITTETGGQVLVDYKAPECTRSALPAPHANGKLCFPQHYAPEGETPTLDWFHKYVVDKVTANDNAAGTDAQETRYDYLSAPAWHFDDSELVKEEKRTWGQFRGYTHVRTRKGVATGTQLASEQRFLRGMDGDRQLNGAVRDEWVTDSWGNRVEDHPAFSGRSLEQTTHDGPSGPWVEGTLTLPTTPVPTAASGSLTAWMVNTATTRTYTRTTVEADGVRWARTDTKYNVDNLPYEVNDLGDEATAADDRCARTWYARNGAIGMVDRKSRVETVGVACTATPSLPADMVSSSRTTYDDADATWAGQAPPTRGLPVRVETLDRWNGTTPVWETTATTGYDDNGRVTSSADALGRTTTTERTPELAGPVTGAVETNPEGHETTTTFAPAWHLPRTVENHDGHVTTLAYDGLGRLAKVWLPGRPTSGPGDQEYDYEVRNDAPTTVTGRKLLPTGDGHRTTITLYDGWLRERQVQAQALGGGRTIAETHYNSRGETRWTAAAFYDDSDAPPGTGLATVSRSRMPSVTETRYDGAGRPVAEVLEGFGQEKWSTTTSYTGDVTVVTPPDGGTRTATRVDARGQVVETRRYHARTGPITAGYVATATTFTDGGEVATVTDPAGNVWTHRYDQRGRKIREEDPDRGVSTAGYDLAGQRILATDARGQVAATEYDDLGRVERRRSGGPDGPVRAEWAYDTVANGTGQVATATRIDDDGDTYESAVTAYDGAGRPTGHRLTLPTSEGALCAATPAAPCRYSSTTSYRHDGQVSTIVLPKVGDLGAEQLTQNYDALGRPSTISSSLGTLLRSVFYDQTGRLTQRTLGAAGKQVVVDLPVDETTGRQDGTTVSPEGQPVPMQLDYDYDPAGNLTRIHDTPFGQTADTQCYGYDHLRRLVDAWTPTGGSCTRSATNPSATALGGPAPYWHSYEYTGAAGLTGSRTREVWHAAGGDTVRTFLYPAQGVTGPAAAGSRPHGLSEVRTDRPGAGPDTVDTYRYDAAGNVAARSLAGVERELGWDVEGELAAITTATPGSPVRYLYDADGERLIRRDPAGTGTTLYLPNGQEVTVAPGSGSTAVGTRHYSHLGATVGLRTKAGGLTFLASDQHGTAELAVRASDLTRQRRRTLPFGGARGTVPTGWPGERAFVDGTQDPQGYVQLGARHYEPATGRFVSVDPLIDQTDPQQMHGYAYGNNAPATFADPTGRMFTVGDGGGGGSTTPACTGTPDRCADQRGLNGPTGGSGGGGGGGGGRGGGTPGGRPGLAPDGGPRESTVTPSTAVAPDPDVKKSKPGFGECAWYLTLGMASCLFQQLDFGTLGFCASGQAALVGNLSGEGCIQADKNGVFFTGTWATTPFLGNPMSDKPNSWGAGLGVGASIEASNARDKNDLAGPFSFGQVGWGPAAGSYSWGNTSDGYPVGVVNAGGGLGLPVSGSGGTSNTAVSGYLFNWCGMGMCNWFNAK